MKRRRLLAAGTAAAGLSLAPRVWARDAEPLRIGAVLPIAGSAIPTSRVNLHAVAEAARMGLTLGEEDGNKNGELMGASMVLTIANAPGPETAARAARRLIARDKASVLVGPDGRDQFARSQVSLRERHWAAEVAGRGVLREAEACTRVGIIDRRRLVALGTPDELGLHAFGRTDVSLEDVFVELTGGGLRDTEASPRDRIQAFRKQGGELTR